MSEGVAVSLKVVEKVASREGTDPVELQPPLHTVIDSEALDALFRSTRSRSRTKGTIEFQYQGYTIRIDSSGEVEIVNTVSSTEQTEPRTSPEESIGD